MSTITKKALCLMVLFSFVWGYSALQATEKTAPASNGEAGKKVEEGNQKLTEEKRKQIFAEATEAIHETESALKYLDENKKTEALSALEKATGKLELILARDSKLALAPSGVSAASYEVVGDIEAVRRIRGEAEQALREGRVQEARRLLQPLGSETVISITNIPLATYPAAIKEAVKFIDSDKNDEAKAVLQTALNTLVVVNKVISHPIALAQQLLKESEKLAEKKDRNSDENKKLSDNLKEARTKLEYAEVLGYGTRKDFKNLYSQLGDIEKKTEKGKSGIGFFARIKSSLSDLVKANETAQNKSEASGPAKKTGKSG